MSVIRQQKRRRRKTNHGAKRLAAVCTLVALTVATAPYISDKLERITAASATLTFGQSDTVQPKQVEPKDINEHVLDGISFNEEAGLLTDPEAESDPIPESSIEPEVQDIPERPDNSGDVVRKTLSAGGSSSFINIGGDSYIKSTTSLSHKKIKEISERGVPFTMEDTAEPQVLIYHTHATESFQPYQVDWYDKSYNARSTDNEKNMIAVGNVLEQKLKDAGIGVIHNTDHFDASYTGAYDRSRKMIEQALKEYPSIKVVLDIHRDAIGSDPVTAPVTTIDGTSTAQVMIISCKGTDKQDVPGHESNLAFAAALQKQMDADYPTLARPTLFGNRFYNQDLSPGALLLEIGGHGNTLEEAKRAMDYTGDSLIKLLKS